MCEHRGPTHCCFGIIARFFARITRCLVIVQEVLNTIWYCFAFHTANKVGMLPNYTTGEQSEIPELKYNVRRGRVEQVQVYQFDHAELALHETVV